MREISDEMIMSWVDGEADEKTGALVEAYLKDNPAGAERVRRFTRTGRELGQLFAAPMSEPVPVRLVEAVRKGLPERDRRAHGRDYWTALLSTLVGQSMRLAPVAALAAAVITGGAIWAVRSDLRGDAPQARLVLQKALETAPSGTEVAGDAAEAAIRVRPAGTFVSVAGQFCREYEMVLPANRAVAGVGCRQNDGRWKVDVQASTELSGRRGTWAPAGRQPVPAVDAAVDRLMAGDMLGAKQEAELIAKRWRR